MVMVEVDDSSLHADMEPKHHKHSLQCYCITIFYLNIIFAFCVIKTSSYHTTCSVVTVQYCCKYENVTLLLLLFYWQKID